MTDYGDGLLARALKAEEQLRILRTALHSDGACPQCTAPTPAGIAMRLVVRDYTRALPPATFDLLPGQYAVSTASPCEQVSVMRTDQMHIVTIQTPVESS